MIPRDALALINEINKFKNKLSKTETGFIASVSIQARSNRLLTQKQSKFLESLYAKATGGGVYQDKQYIR